MLGLGLGANKLRGGGLTLQQIFETYGGLNQWVAEKSTVVSTTTTWLDYASTPLDLANPAAANQPTTNSPDTDFNNRKSATFLTDDYLIKNSPNYGSGQTTGSIWAVVKTGANFTGTPVIFSANNTANTVEKVLLYIDASGKILLIIHNGTTVNTLTSVNALSINTKYIIEVESNGSATSVYIDGVLQTLTGTNNGFWFAYANTGNTLDNVVIGATIRASSNLYYNGKIAFVGNYPLLSPANRTAMFTALNTYYGVY